MISPTARCCTAGSILNRDVVRPLGNATADMSKWRSPKPGSSRVARSVLARRFNRTWRQGQLPGGQTAKARPAYRVQSLHKGHGRHSIESKHNNSDTQDGCLSCCVQSVCPELMVRLKQLASP